MKIISKLGVVTVAIAAIAAVASAVYSLQWRYTHDTPLMIYAGYLIDQGKVPYRDFFEMNMPGTYAAMWIMGNLFGWDDSGSRLFDLTCLASICISTFIWLRKEGNLPAIAAPAAFTLCYLSMGPMQSLQRELIALVPFTAMLALTAPRQTGLSVARILFAGILAGITFSIKPHMLLLALPILPGICRQGYTTSRPWQKIAMLGAGAAIPTGAILAYMIATNSLQPFLEIARNYWPLYTHMTGDHIPISGTERLLYIAKESIKGLMNFHTAIAIIGLLAMDSAGDKRLQRILVGLLATAAIYPGIAGQFWQYHWIPFYYVALCTAAMVTKPIVNREIGKICATLTLAVILAKNSWQIWKNGKDQHNERADEIAEFLLKHRNPDDTVQPLDWSGGAIHGMLMAKAPIATRFIYDFHFYHHIDQPYTHQLRAEFMAEMNAEKPKFVVQIEKVKPWPQGPNTTKEFPELKAFLTEHYRTAKEEATYRILERK